MKALTTAGLTELITLIKNTFLNKTDTINVSDALSTVALTGSYNDLSNKPSIPSVISDLTDVTISSASSGQILSYNGTNWANANSSSVLPSQTGNSGKFLTTNGTTASWGTVDALPSQTSQSGKFLTTNGTTASWGTPSDTLNTAGSTDSSSKLFLIGATSQTASSQTYSHDTVFVDTSGRLNSAAPASSANDTTVATTKWVKDQGYTTNTGTVTSVNNTAPVNGNVTLSIPAAQVNSDWNASSGVAQILNKPSIPSAISDLSDVTVTSATNGQILSYDSSASKWVNTTPSPGGTQVIWRKYTTT